MDNIDQWFKRVFDKDPSRTLPDTNTNPQQDGFGKTKEQNLQASKPHGSSQQAGQSGGRKKFFNKRKQGGQPSQQQNNANAQHGKNPVQQQHAKPLQHAKPQHGNPHSRPDRHGKRGFRSGHLNKDLVQRAPAKPGKETPIIKNKLKIIPLGGLDEVGKNMMAVEYEEDIVIIDMGFEFPGEDLLGIDYVVPDVSYLEDNKKRIRGVLLTHGHLDHIGGIPYILPRLDFPPVFGAKLTMGLVEHRIKEFKQEKAARLHVIDPAKPLKLGNFIVKFIRVMHSIPDALAIVLETPAGKIMHTGDFKFDATPARNMVKDDIDKMEALGRENVLALFSESTNALKPGHTISEKQVGEALEEAVSQAKGRLIIASFSSQIGRVQQIIDAAAKTGRKVYVSGRSMRNNISIAHKLGYLSIEKNMIFDVKKYRPKENPDDKTLILTTGSQGEPVAALARMANNTHDHIKIEKGDTVVLSSSPIPGNERAIHTIINSLCIMGANVINNELMDIHTSGHAKQDELKRMINYIKPRYLVPIHGEFYMRQGLANLAIKECGMSEDRVIMIQNGDVLLGENNKLYKSDETVETKYILIDGSGEGQLDSQVLVDRQIMSQNGAVIVLVYVSKNGRLKGDPDVVTRGFIYMHESEAITKEIIKITKDAYGAITAKNRGANRKDIKKYIRQTVDRFTHKTLERSPLVVPLIIES